MPQRRRDQRIPPGSPQPPASAVSPKATSGLLSGYSFILVVSVVILYLPITDHSFCNFDDDQYIYENPHLRAGLNFAAIKWAFTSFYAANWHPLTWLVHAFNIQVFGFNPGSHHLVSLVLHAANAVLCFLVLYMITGTPGRSFVVTALFALHPLCVESVAWAAELKNVLSTFFWFITIAAYAYYCRKPSIIRYALVVVSFAAGLAAKPMIVSLPFLLLLLDYWPLGRLQRLSDPCGNHPHPSVIQLGLEKVPLFILSALSSWITIRAQEAWGATRSIHPSLGLRMANGFVAYATYLAKMFVPTALAPFYPFPLEGISAWKVVLSALVVLAISTASVFYARRYPYLFVGWFWFLGTLVPVIGLLQVGAQSHADRYMYFPMIGLLIMVVWGLLVLADAWKISRQIVNGLAVLALACLGVLTSRQIGYWRSSETLWTHTLSVTEDNAVAERNLVEALLRKDKVQEAYPHMLRAVQFDPDDFTNHNNLGNVYNMQGRQEDSLREFKTVIEKAADPNERFRAFVNSGVLYYKHGDLIDAESSYRQALGLFPDNPTAQAGLAAVERAKSSSLTAPSN